MRARNAISALFFLRAFLLCRAFQGHSGASPVVLRSKSVDLQSSEHLRATAFQIPHSISELEKSGGWLDSANTDAQKVEAINMSPSWTTGGRWDKNRVEVRVPKFEAPAYDATRFQAKYEDVDVGSLPYAMRTPCLHTSPSRLHAQILHSPAKPRGRKPMVLLSRHGQSQANAQDMIGMDMGLTPEGAKYAVRLGQWAKENLGTGGGSVVIMRSDMVRTSETVEGVLNEGLDADHELEIRSQLNEIHAGDFEGWTFSEFRASATEEYAARMQNKLRYRYPGGESYLDLLHRVKPVVEEIKQFEAEGKDILVVAHQATLRCVLAELMGLNDEEREIIPSIDVPLHSLVKVERVDPSSDTASNSLIAQKRQGVGKQVKFAIVETLPLL